MNEQANDDSKRITIAVKLTQRVFDTDVELSASADVHPKDAAFQHGTLSTYLVDAMADFHNNCAPFLPTAPQVQDPVTEQWQDVTAYTVEDYSGERVVKILTEEYYHYGVKIFPEVLASAGYAIAGLELGITKPLNWKVLIGRDSKGRPLAKRLKTPSSSK